MVSVEEDRKQHEDGESSYINQNMHEKESLTVPRKGLFGMMEHNGNNFRFKCQ